MTATAEGYAKLKLDGICTICRAEKPPEGYATCGSCREKRKIYRASLKRAKICTHCKRKALPNITVCLRHKKEQNARARERYGESKAAGHCRRCGEVSKTRLCRACYELSKDYKKNTEARRRAEGMCTECGKEPALVPFKLGPKCRQKNIDTNAAWRAKPGIGKHQREKVRKRREALVARGLCGSCGKRPVGTKVYRSGRAKKLKRCHYCLKTNLIGHAIKRARRARVTKSAASA